MDVKKTYDDIQNLSNLIYLINKRDYKAIEELNRLHRIAFGSEVFANCSNCHIKAYKKLMSLTIKDLQEMENQNFKISPEHLIEWPAGTGTFYSSTLGIPNEVAVDYLKRFPKNIDKFSVYPGSESESGELDLGELKKQPSNKKKAEADQDQSKK